MVNKYYAVRKGKIPGIYESWGEAETQDIVELSINPLKLWKRLTFLCLRIVYMGPL